MRTRFLIDRAVPALLSLCASLAVWAADSPLIGHEAPDFALRATAGDNVRLSEARGQVVVLSFYGSRCNTCRSHLAALDSLYRTYAPAGLAIYGVSIDDDTEAARRFAASLGVGFPMLADPAKAVGRAYAVDRLPTLVIVDREGKVRYVHRDPGSRGEPPYVGELRRLLDE
ncbi:MAG: Thiol-disulfide oxidoreductase ResA [Steroidobacteraceae bacterium]|nr:Thiol-disulfide oxidoreductase ResA [Steroidobacteraceae bacterium]